jgi:hypothetical protein
MDKDQIADTPRRATTNAVAVRRCEHRSCPRYSFTATVVAMEPISGTVIHARTTDLSLGGCYVDTMSPFPQGTTLHVQLTDEGRSFKSDATVLVSHLGMGMGLIFTATEPDQRQELGRWMAGLTGEASPLTHDLEQDERAVTEYCVRNEHSHVLNELVISLMRKGVLDEEEGEGMLARLLR